MLDKITIIQGSNDPIEVEPPTGVSFADIEVLSVGLYNDATGLGVKTWDKESIEIKEDGSLSCPLTQEETAAMQTRMTLCIKYKDATGRVVLIDECPVLIGHRKDKGVIL